MSELLAGETAVITGASSGNGRGIALTFAEHGADIIVADIQKEPRSDDRPTAEVIREDTDTDAKFERCDVTNIAELRRP